MPRVGEVGPVVLYVYKNDHNPPHFHGAYAEHEALISIDAPRVIKGELPAARLRPVLEWAEENQALLWKWWNDLNP